MEVHRSDISEISLNLPKTNLSRVKMLLPYYVLYIFWYIITTTKYKGEGLYSMEQEYSMEGFGGTILRNHSCLLLRNGRGRRFVSVDVPDETNFIENLNSIQRHA